MDRSIDGSSENGGRKKMKKVLLIILAVILVFGAASCGKKEESKQHKPFKEIYEEIEKKVSFPDMMNLDAEFIENYYGIDTSKFSDFIFSEATISIQVDTVIMAEVGDPKDLEDMKSKIQFILDSKAAEMENYLVDKYNTVKKAEVKTKGNIIYLVISEQAADIEKIIEEHIA